MKKIVIICCILIASISLIATTYVVDQGGQGDFTTIQAAVDSAQDGDIITVHNGTYVENLIIDNKDITLQSESGNAEDCIIDGNNTGHVIEITSSNNTTIMGFSIINSGATFHQHISVYNPVINYLDSGIKSYATGNTLIKDCVFDNVGHSITIIYSSGEFDIVSNNFFDLNEVMARYILAIHADNVKISNSEFITTTTFGNGELIQSWDGKLIINNNTFFNSSYCTTIGLRGIDYATISNNTFNMSNHTTAVNVTSTDVDIINNEITGGPLATCYHAGSNPKIGVFASNLVVGGYNAIEFEDIMGSVSNFKAYIRNNTIVSCTTGIQYDDDTDNSNQNEILEFKNNIIWDTPTPFNFESAYTQDLGILIEYSCIDGGVPDNSNFIDGTGNISLDPLFNDPNNSDYTLAPTSPCIDTGDPDSEPDLDGSRADMGCFAYEHDYDTKTIKPGYNWVSFPRIGLDPNYNTATNIIPVLENMEYFASLDYLDFYFENSDPVLTWDNFDLWSLQDFDSKSSDGYKFKTSATYEQELIVSGARLAEDHSISETFSANEEVWLGYWLFNTQDIDLAFGEFWDDIISIKSKNWHYLDMNSIRAIDDKEPLPSMEIRPLVYGEGYIVKFKNDVTNFHWTNSQSVSEPVVIKKSTNFTYQEKADYETIDLLNIPAGVEEIGVFEDEICLGAVVVQDSAEQVLVYSEAANRNAADFTFEFSYNARSSEKIQKYEVLNLQTGNFAAQPLTAGRNEYSVVRFQPDSAEEQAEDTPLQIELFNNYPNPFNPTTTISFNLPTAQEINLGIYNIKGQKVKTIYSGTAEPGRHSMVWSGVDSSNKAVASGVYFYQLQTAEKTYHRKMLLMK